MSYRVHSIFKTIQGEGFNAGRAAVFLRFAGCNLWSGREEDRSAAICPICDTDFVGGSTFESWPHLADHVESAWDGGKSERVVVCTGGEPALQLDRLLVDGLRARGFKVHVETNGTKVLPGVDWLTVSPKPRAQLAFNRADELKLLFPFEGADPAELDGFSATHRFIQPIDGPGRDANTAAAVAYCLANPRWRLSLQMHKIAGIA